MKIIKSIVYVLLFAIISPTFLFLVSCGATPINEVKAVYFYSDLYDKETGYAVFELDMNEATYLTCKVNPSGWKGNLTFNALDQGGENANYFYLGPHSGIFIIQNEDYKTIEVQVIINLEIAGTYKVIEDRCIVKKKEYPNRISFNNNQTEATLYLNSLGASSLHIYGNYDGGITREISESDYHFELVSSDPSTIYIPDSTRLTFYSLKSKIDAVDVDVYLMNSSKRKVNADDYNKEVQEKYGDRYLYQEHEVFKLTLHVIVVLPSSYSLAYFEGCDTFIENGDTVDITINENFSYDTIGTDKYYKLNFQIELFSSSGQSKHVYLNREEYTVNCTSNQDSYVNIDNENGVFKIRKPNNDNNNLSVNISIATSANDVAKQVYKMEFTINFHFDI